MQMPVRVGIAGASGYTGVELLRLCANHADLDVVRVGASANVGARVSDLYPSLSAAYPGVVFEELSADDMEGLDVAFLALPHGASQELVPDLLDRVPLTVDLSADFRLQDPAAYTEWYGRAHAAPELLKRAVYGLPELNRKEIAGARLVAAPG